jgi:hypothetical protein
LKTSKGYAPAKNLICGTLHKSFLKQEFLIKIKSSKNTRLTQEASEVSKRISLASLALGFQSSMSEEHPPSPKKFVTEDDYRVDAFQSLEQS